MTTATGGFFEQTKPSFPVAAATGQYIRVKFSAGALAVDGASGNDHIGVTNRETFNAGDLCSITQRRAHEIKRMVASGTFSLHAKVYKSANGKIAGSGTVLIGIALEASTASGDIVEVLELESIEPAANVAALTDNSGGAAADGTIAVVTAPTALTDNGGGTADGTVAAMADLATAGGNTYADSAVNTVLGHIRNNFKELTTAQAANRLAIVALTDGLKEVATTVNALLVAAKAKGLIAPDA